MLLLYLLLFMFGTGIYMIQLNRFDHTSGDNYELIFDYSKGESELGLLLESAFYQYNMLLGEYGDGSLRRSLEGLSGEMRTAVIIENYLAVLYFFGTTFFTQITILNMLIAIMSSTYQKHSSNLKDLGNR